MRQRRQHQAEAGGGEQRPHLAEVLLGEEQQRPGEAGQRQEDPGAVHASIAV